MKKGTNYKFVAFHQYVSSYDYSNGMTDVLNSHIECMCIASPLSESSHEASDWIWMWMCNCTESTYEALCQCVLTCVFLDGFSV